MPPPQFSIIITCYNKSATIVETVKSAKAQELPVQIIVVDDLSTDGSIEILKKLNAIDLILLDENMGALNAYLHGMRHAKGNYLVLLDGDDLLVPGFLKWLDSTTAMSPDTSLRFGMTSEMVSGQHTISDSKLKTSFNLKPGWLFPALQLTGGTAYIFPRALFQEADRLLNMEWPDIKVQDHILPAVIGLVSNRFMKIKNVGYIYSKPNVRKTLSQNARILHHDRLISDLAIEKISRDQTLKLNRFCRGLLLLALLKRARRLNKVYGMKIPKFFQLAFNSSLREKEIRSLAAFIKDQ